MAQRNFDAQVAAIRNLSEPNRFERGRYEITEFQVEEWEGNHVHVRRVRRPLHAERVAYHESYCIGPRGAVRVIYSNLI